MKLQPKKIAMGLAVGFILLTVWKKPAESGESTGDFIGDATDWVQDAFDKVSEFSENVVE